MHDATIHMSREAMLAHTIADTLNTSGFNYNHFNEAMANEHRTLQTFFMKLILNYINFAASEDYRTDQRNKRAHEIAKYIDFCLDGVNTYLPSI